MQAIISFIIIMNQSFSNAVIVQVNCYENLTQRNGVMLSVRTLPLFFNYLEGFCVLKSSTKLHMFNCYFLMTTTLKQKTVVPQFMSFCY